MRDEGGVEPTVEVAAAVVQWLLRQTYRHAMGRKHSKELAAVSLELEIKSLEKRFVELAAEDKKNSSWCH